MQALLIGLVFHFAFKLPGECIKKWNGIYLTVKNSRTLLVGSSRFSKSLEPCPVYQKKAIYQEYIKPNKVKQLKLLPDYDRTESVWHLPVS